MAKQSVGLFHDRCDMSSGGFTRLSIGYSIKGIFLNIWSSGRNVFPHRNSHLRTVAVGDITDRVTEKVDCRVLYKGLMKYDYKHLEAFRLENRIIRA